MKTEILKETIKKRGYLLNFIAKELNLSKGGLSLKLNGTNEFKLSEINILIKILKLNEKETQEIFFT